MSTTYDTERPMPETKSTSIARHAVIVAALACGIGLGAAFGLAVFDSTDMTLPVVMVPQVETPTSGPTGPAQPLPEHDPASKPALLPLPKPIGTASEGAPVAEGAPPATAERSRSEVSSPTADGPSHPDLAPPPSGQPGDKPVTVDIDLPQLPQPEPANPQKPGPTVELGPASDLPAMKPQLPPKVILVSPKSRWTVNGSVQKPSKPKRGTPTKDRTRVNSIAKAGTAGDE
jgi:hypothetical protein